MKKIRTKNPKISRALKKKHSERIQNNIETLPDYIYSKKHNNSLKILIENHPNGVSDSSIAKMLRIRLPELNQMYNKILVKLKSNLTKENENGLTENQETN